MGTHVVYTVNVLTNRPEFNVTDFSVGREAIEKLLFSFPFSFLLLPPFNLIFLCTPPLHRLSDDTRISIG